MHPKGVPSVNEALHSMPNSHFISTGVPIRVISLVDGFKIHVLPSRKEAWFKIVPDCFSKSYARPLLVSPAAWDPNGGVLLVLPKPCSKQGIACIPSGKVAIPMIKLSVHKKPRVTAFILPIVDKERSGVFSL
eukprot:2399689-Amphidinium_carterae.1